MKRVFIAMTGLVWLFPCVLNPISTAIASEPNLVAYWNFDEGTGTIAHDSAGSNNGQIINGPVWTSSKTGMGLSFDGSNDYINVPDNPSLRFSQYDSFSICYWAKPSQDGGYTTCKWAHSPYNTFGYATYWTESSKRFGFTAVRSSGSGSWTTICTPNNLAPAGSWYHVANVYLNGDMRIYLNGQLSNSGTFIGGTGTSTPQSPMTIGMREYDYFGGIIDDVRIYNKALSNEEIQQLYLPGAVKADNPNPAYGASGIWLNTTLSWGPGIYAISHNVYLGTDFDDVNDATVSIPPGVYKGPVDVNHYDPVGLLPDTTYYWRIDEMNDVNTWKGSVWNFATTVAWKNEIDFPNEQFKSAMISENDPGWVKFTIILAPQYDPNIVYFQNSKEYMFHYDFATQFLTPFIGMSAQEYYNIALYEANQEAALGAVIMPSEPDINEYGIQFIRYDAYTKEEIAEMFNTVKAKINAGPNVQAFYFPCYEQLASAEANRLWLEEQGIPIGSTARWATGNVCYSAGWALGTLKYFDGNAIGAAYAGGELLPEDILLTDGVPAEIPFVAGILTLTPSTPSSHVAILAQTFGVPFGHLALAADANRAEQLVGRFVILSVSENDGVGNIKITDMTGLLTSEEINQILAIKTPKPLDITAMEHYGSYSANTNGLEPNDIRYFGGKAANFGMLRRAIPDNCPNAAAISFDLWNEFLNQTLGNGKTLRQEIAGRLSPFIYPPSNLPALYAELEYIRENLFKDADVTGFTQTQIDAIISILEDPNYGFDPNRNIRFRSSTNVEDANQFSGAGLYDSFSGCLADDIDGDTQGPCICDPVESKERGVFRAIRKVYASFYNDNAYLERLRHGIDENEVGMGLLVHHSSPDQFELANGVATLEKRQGDPNRYIKLVTQKDAVSVSNPQDGSIPEEVSVLYKSESEIELMFMRSSNLVILGQTVLDWPGDYNGFSRLLVAAADEYEAETGKTNYLLDFEYKKLLPGGSLPNGGLAIKQIREIPEPNQSVTATTPFLVNAPVTYITLQEGGTFLDGDIFSSHRLKSRWTIGTKSMWLTAENLSQSFYADVNIEYAAEGQIRTISGKLPMLPNASHSFAGTSATDGFRMRDLSNPRTYTLTTNNVKTQFGPAESLIVTLSDLGDIISFAYAGEPTLSGRALNIRAVYAKPPWSGEPRQDNIRIMPQPSDSSFEERTLTYEEWPIYIYISTSFYYANQVQGDLHTNVLSHFGETTIYGLTTEPIVLNGYYSQTYCPGRHNAYEEFIFEPRLEPGISQSILDELEAQNIHLIYAYKTGGWESYNIITLSYDEAPFLLGDIDNDGNVDFPDYARLSSQWLGEACDECNGADLTGDGRVDMDDLWEFAQQWLEQI